MDRDFLLDLFAAFGPVTLRRMFSGFGISAGEVNFALALRSGVYLHADDHTIPRFEAEGCKPFQYTTRARTVTVRSYWQMPERLYDDPDELAVWARAALEAARRAAAKKRPKRDGARPAKRATAPGTKAAKQARRASVKK